MTHFTSQRIARRVLMEMALKASEQSCALARVAKPKIPSQEAQKQLRAAKKRAAAALRAFEVGNYYKRNTNALLLTRRGAQLPKGRGRVQFGL
jgi:hypothetical protein